MKHIYKVIYDLSVDLVIFDLRLPLKIKWRSQTFKWVVFHKKCIIWSLYEIHKASHIWPFSLPYDMYNIWPLMKLKGQIKVIGFSVKLTWRPRQCWTKVHIPPPYGRTSRVWDSLLVMKSGCAGGRGFAPWPGQSKESFSCNQETGKVLSPEMPFYSKF